MKSNNSKNRILLCADRAKSAHEIAINYMVTGHKAEDFRYMNIDEFEKRYFQTVDVLGFVIEFPTGVLLDIEEIRKIYLDELRKYQDACADVDCG